MATRETGRITALVAPAVRAGGFDLEQVTVRRVGGRSLVRVVVDRDGGLDLDAVADATRAVSRALDDADPIRGSYVLEVTSPGVERPLREPRHWRRAVGRLVGVTGPEGRLVGRLVAAGEDGIELECAGRRVALGYPDISAGTVQVEFGGSR